MSDAAYEAIMRSNFEQTVRGMETDLVILEKELGLSIDAGSFFLGATRAVWGILGLDVITTAAKPAGKRLLLEAFEKARQAHG